MSNFHKSIIVLVAILLAILGPLAYVHTSSPLHALERIGVVITSSDSGPPEDTRKIYINGFTLPQIHHVQQVLVRPIQCADVVISNSAARWDDLLDIMTSLQPLTADLSGTKIESPSSRRFSAKLLHRVEHFYLSDNLASERLIADLAEARSLRSVGLIGVDISDEMSEAIELQCESHTIFLDNSRVSDLGVKHVLNCRNLIFLGVDGCNVSPLIFEALQSRSRPLVISAKNTQITSESIPPFIKNNKNIVVNL